MDGVNYLLKDEDLLEAIKAVGKIVAETENNKYNEDYSVKLNKLIEVYIKRATLAYYESKNPLERKT